MLILFSIVMIIIFTNTVQYKNEDLDKAFHSLYDLLQYNSSFDLLLQNGVQNPKCAEKLALAKDNSAVLANVISFSGLSAIDIGKESECMATNMLYILLTYDISFENNPFLDQYFKFVEEDTSIRGICVWSECYDFFINFFNVTTNPQLEKTLADEKITNLKIFNHDLQIGKKNKSVEEYKKKYKVDTLHMILLGLLIYVIFRIIMTIVAIFMSNSESEQKNENDIIDINGPSLDNSLCSDKANENLSSFEHEKISEKSFMKKVFLFSSLNKSFKILMKKRSKYYNESNMVYIAGFRFIIMFLISIGHNSWAIAKLPHKELSGLLSENNNNLWFALIKCGILSFELLKVLNGIQFGFKFMCYYKKFPSNHRFTFVDMLKFYFKIIPQFIMFQVAIFCFHYYIMEYGLVLSSNIGYEYFVTNTLYKIDCLKNPLRIIIPFYYQYLHNNESDHCFTGCHRNICFAMSEFYCFTILCLLLFILIKLRSKLADFIVSICVILLLPLAYFKYPEKLGDEITLSKIYGSFNSFLYPHIFIILYFFGFNLGIMLWGYHKTNTQEVTTYQLFWYNHTFVGYYSTVVKTSIKIIIFVLSLGLMIVVMFNYNIIYAIYKQEGVLLIKSNFIIKFLFIYEGQIFGIAFLGLALVLMLNSSGLAENFKLLLENIIFIPIGRICTAFFLLDNFYITVFYSTYTTSIYSNVKTTIFISLPLFLINLFMSLIIVILFELPFRIIYKKITNSKKIKTA